VLASNILAEVGCRASIEEAKASTAARLKKYVGEKTPITFSVSDVVEWEPIV
jgi:hypothetical protein